MIRKQLLLLYCFIGLTGMVSRAQVPTPNFTASITTGCGPLSVSFKDLSTGSPIYWEWDFGNGQISSLQNPSTVYASPGTYTVTLIVRNASGANSVRRTDYITVYPFPTAAFSSTPSQVACAPVNVNFTDKSTPGQGSVVGWSWNFGDNSPLDNRQDPSHTYTQTGYYTVSLTVTNSQGCSNTSAQQRYIRVIPGVQANFTWEQTSTSCSAPFTLGFLNQTAGPGNLTYAWNFGNGSNPTSSTQTNPSTTYPTNANYTVTLTATSDLGCSQTIQQVVSLTTGSAKIAGPDSACINSPATFHNVSSPPPLSSYWDFGDGTNSTDSAPSKTWSTLGTYKVKLINTYAACSDSTTIPIKVVPQPTPVFSASPTAGCQIPLTVNFTDNTPNATGWQWDFGDGTTSTQQNPSHPYTTAGSFDVTLTVTTKSGCTGTIVKQKYIQITPPAATILQPLQGCSGSPVTPVAAVNAIDGIAAYSWNAPGATPSTSTSPTPSFVFPAQGNYSITLTVTTNGGCTTTPYTSPVLIGSPVTPSFTVSPSNDLCGGTQFTFTSTSNPADHWAWDFGDGTKAGNINIATHTYTDTGTFVVQMTATNNGCSITGGPTKVHVKPPVANFAYSVDCNNRRAVTFSDSSIVDPSQPITYTWDFGDGTPTVSLSSPPTAFPFTPPQSHVYPALGSYQATLTVTNGTCTDIVAKTVALSTLTVSIVVPPVICRNAPFILNANVSDPSQVKTYSWQVGTNPVSTADTPSYTLKLPANGPYPVTLAITDIFGCAYPPATTTINVTGPTAKFTPAQAGTCQDSTITFIDASTPSPTTTPIYSWIYYFGDGTNHSFAGPPYTHQYTDTGSYQVELVVNDASGCSDAYLLPTRVQITAPRAGFYQQDTLPFYCPDKPLQFVDTSKGYGLTYTWDFGDGSPGSTDPAPAHPFANNPNPYTIKLKVTDQYGCTDSLIRANYVRIQVPIPAFTMTDSTSICIPLQTIFTPNAQYYDSLYWDFGDGTTSTLPNTSHFYNAYDTFSVSLILRGPGGCLDTATQRVLVLNPYTTTSFTYSPLKHCDSIFTNFTVVPPGYTRFTVYFGDGKADSSQNKTPGHLYNSPSTYAPQMLLQDSTGCIVGIPGGSGFIVVLGAVPFFNMDKHNFCDSGTVNFTDFTITNDAPISKTWDFGDGTSVTNPDPSNPTHYYTTPGTLLPTLKVSTNSGCMESYTDTVHVWQTPHPQISMTPPFCINVAIPFQGNLLTPDVDSVAWSWNFANGQSSDLQDPTISFPQPGSYAINLRTSVSFGCSDSITQNLTINPRPSIKGPGEITTPVGFPVTIPFTYGANVVDWSWTPANNLSCTDCANPVANPTFSTLYTVLVTDSNNCTSIDSIMVTTICNGKNYFVPNTFSPNGDGVNDVFYPRGDNLYNIQSMTIFNRWGQMVFQRRDFPANSQSMGWDGTINGRPAPSDAYVYIIEVVCNNAQIVALKGNVTLVR